LARFLKYHFKTITMKKILLLLVIFISVHILKAQSIYNNNGIQKDISHQYILPRTAIVDNITVFPNPVSDVLKISLKSSEKSLVAISLFNNIGKQVYQQEYIVNEGNNVFAIEIRNKAIEPGIYFVQIVIDNEVITRKLIVK